MRLTLRCLNVILQSYNAVIFAHPAEKGELEIKGANVKTVPIRTDFSLAVVATVQGEIDCSYFGLDFPCVRDLPRYVGALQTAPLLYINPQYVI